MVAFIPVRGGGHLLSHGDRAPKPFQAAMISVQPRVGRGNIAWMCAELDVVWRTAMWRRIWSCEPSTATGCR
jgi:hypothetical protein